MRSGRGMTHDRYDDQGSFTWNLIQNDIDSCTAFVSL
jgi:hypothetical protein